MNRTANIAGLMLALLFCAVGKSMAQDQEVSAAAGKLANQIDSVVQEKIERSIKEKESEWRLTDRAGSGDTSVNHLWKSGEKEARISITYLASQEDAAKRLQQTRSTIPVGPGFEIENLGDEAYWWPWRGIATIRLRKGSVVVTITVDPVDFAKLDKSTLDLNELNKSALNIAKRFAQHIVDEIESK